MKLKLKLCAGCDEMKHIWKNDSGNRYCQYCWQSKNLKSPTAVKKALKPKSDKKNVLDVLYTKMRKEFLNLPENSTCKAKFQGCLNVFKEELTVHHMKGRGKYYLDKSTWLPLCWSCHDHVELHPEMARELGLSRSKVSDD